ncbi:MAG: hypothetical protein QUV05_00470 [Phycisphaerae bacterium]|nr:hypothetical protein [Phycisphaerae bacterium]
MIQSIEETTSVVPLDPELAVCIQHEAVPTVRHPLVNFVCYSPKFNDQLNKQLRYKKEAMDHAVSQRDWETCIWLHERPWRIDALRKLASVLSDKEYFRLLGSVWMDSESLWQYRRLARGLLSPRGRSLEARRCMMNNEELEVFDLLPNPVVVYRGCGRGNQLGWSWTLDRKQAEWFARRFASLDDGRFGGLVLVGECHSSSVVAYFTGRNESEVLVDPRDVTIRETIKVSDKESDDDE